METRLFKHGGSTYLFTKESQAYHGYPNDYEANLRVVNRDGSVSEPLITKKRDGSSIIRKNSRFASGVSGIDPWNFDITEGDKLTLSGALSRGKVEYVSKFEIPVDKNGRISSDSLEDLSPIAKRWLRKVGEFLAKIR